MLAGHTVACGFSGSAANKDSSKKIERLKKTIAEQEEENEKLLKEIEKFTEDSSPQTEDTTNLPEQTESEPKSKVIIY